MKMTNLLDAKVDDLELNEHKAVSFFQQLLILDAQHHSSA